MIIALEKKYLDDNFVEKYFLNNLNINDKLIFNKNNIYYFGNYKKENINIIKEKLIKNRKNIIRAIENNVKFIITGNSYDIFNNSFKPNNLNIFTSYNDKMFKNYINKLIIKKDKSNNKLLIINNLNKGINNKNFKYKNFLCVNNPKIIHNLIKKQSKSTLL